jgi:predicted ATPase with chaperone activity
VGSHCDLAVATALLGELDLVDRETTSEHLFFGQFGNDGQVTRMSGAVLAALFAEERELALVAPAAQMAVLQNVPNLRTIPISSFHELVSYLKTGRHNDTEKHYKVERALPRVNQANSNRFWADIHSLEIEIIANLKQRTER